MRSRRTETITRYLQPSRDDDGYDDDELAACELSNANPHQWKPVVAAATAAAEAKAAVEVRGVGTRRNGRTGK